ncbi:hypothetical protein MMC17_008617 [Xylographa soralifera]|nr:hypothetical protein [Xylographa soralifera]
MSSSSSDISSLIASFDNEAGTYDTRLGTATRSVSDEIIDMLFPSLRRSTSGTQSHTLAAGVRSRAKVLDVACGTGSFSLTLVARCVDVASSAVESIFASDIAPGMVKLTSAAVRDRHQRDTPLLYGKAENGLSAGQSYAGDGPLLPRVSTAVCDGQDFTQLFPSSRVFDLIVNNFGIFFFPDVARGAAEMYRLLSDDPAAAAVATCWRYMGSWPIFLEIQRRIAPKRPIEGRTLQKWKDGTILEATLKDAGFAHVVLEQTKVVQWAYGITALSRSIVELLRGQVALTWTPEEMDADRLARVTEEILKEKKDDYLVEIDGDKGGSEDMKIGYELIAWIAIARKNIP